MKFFGLSPNQELCQFWRTISILFFLCLVAGVHEELEFGPFRTGSSYSSSFAAIEELAGFEMDAFEELRKFQADHLTPPITKDRISK
jgi:hypothetical protein